MLQLDFVKQFNVDPRILEGIAGDRIRALKSQYKQVQIQNNFNDEKIAFTNQQIAVFNTKLGASNNDIRTVVDHVTTNPSRQKNELFADWAIARLQSGTMEIKIFEDLFMKPQYMRDGKMVSFFDQFKGQKWLVDVRTALENARADFRQAWGKQRADTIAQVNEELAKFVDDKILNDQFIDREEEVY